MDAINLSAYRIWRQGRSAYPGQGSFAGIIYCGLGLGEAGELIGEIKKAWRDDHSEEDDALTPERHQKIIDEMGDVLWYLDALADELGVDLEQVLQANVEKINHRVSVEKRNVG